MKTFILLLSEDTNSWISLIKTPITIITGLIVLGFVSDKFLTPNIKETIDTATGEKKYIFDTRRVTKIDPETGDHYYAFERAPNIIEAQRKSMGLSKSRFNVEYWGMKQEYLTKKLGNKIIFNFTKM